MASFAEALLYFSDYIYRSDKFLLPLTRSEMGEYIGTTRETVTRMIHDLSQDGIIEVNSKTLRILNKGILYKISSTNDE
jgi:CRP/FNR family transcriptional regulator